VNTKDMYLVISDFWVECLGDVRETWG